MPNNPGRIDGDYSIGEREEVKYINPGNFGAVRNERPPISRTYTFALAVIALAAIAIMAFGFGLI